MRSSESACAQRLRLLLRSDQSPLRADARLHIPHYFAYGADEGDSALGPVSEHAPAHWQGGCELYGTRVVQGVVPGSTK
jgi:hypothetical protein